MPYDNIKGENVKNIQLNIASFWEYKVFVNKHKIKRESILKTNVKPLNNISELPNNI